MIVGTVKEIKVHEYRVGLTPTSVRELTHHGHEVLVQSGAGDGIGCHDDDYRAAGAELAKSAEEVFASAEMIIKVKEPQPEETALLRDGQVLFTYLHLAPNPEETRALMDSGCIAIAYETVTGPHGSLPLLAPMSAVAGRMSVQVGAHCLEKEQGGRGVLLSGVPGVPAARVVILGGGTVGANAARMALGLEARVTVIDKYLPCLQALDTQFGPRLDTVFATVETIEANVLDADLVIGAALVPGDAAPKLVTEDMVKSMRRGSVLVDVAIDQGGCFETSHPTTHADPTFTKHDVVHYCVANMPGAVARTSTFALNNATLPFTLALADQGYKAAMKEDEHLRAGLNVHRGVLTHAGVAHGLGWEFEAVEGVV